jgi:hypothetical protein
MLRTKEWFINRIGKRVYRDHHDCCVSCEDVAKNGLTVSDYKHADYLYSLQLDFHREGLELNYRTRP